MSGISDVDDPRGLSRYRLDCELMSTASFAPKDSVEGANASVPNVENEAATAALVEPISSLRVSFS
jgi:hypothetical protein